MDLETRIKKLSLLEVILLIDTLLITIDTMLLVWLIFWK